MNKVDLAFPLTGDGPIAADHGYGLYGSLSKICQALHESVSVGIHPIRGKQIGNRLLSLAPHSRLVVRTPVDLIGNWLGLTGQQIQLAKTTLQIGVPQVHALHPATTLRSRLVTIKLADEITESAFMESAMRQLKELGISEHAIISIPQRESPSGAVPRRRTIAIKDKQVVGYEMILEGLSAEESLSLQEQGIGGRRKMGCGIFLPIG